MVCVYMKEAERKTQNIQGKAKILSVKILVSMSLITIDIPENNFRKTSSEVIS